MTRQARLGYVPKSRKPDRWQLAVLTLFITWHQLLDGWLTSAPPSLHPHNARWHFQNRQTRESCCLSSIGPRLKAAPESLQNPFTSTLFHIPYRAQRIDVAFLHNGDFFILRRQQWQRSHPAASADEASQPDGTAGDE